MLRVLKLIVGLGLVVVSLLPHKSHADDVIVHISLIDGVYNTRKMSEEVSAYLSKNFPSSRIESVFVDARESILFGQIYEDTLRRDLRKKLGEIPFDERDQIKMLVINTEGAPRMEKPI